MFGMRVVLCELRDEERWHVAMIVCLCRWCEHCHGWWCDYVATIVCLCRCSRRQFKPSWFAAFVVCSVCCLLFVV